MGIDAIAMHLTARTALMMYVPNVNVRNMIKQFLFDWLLKDYIEGEIDRRFKENMIERYWTQKHNETARRIAELRKAYLPSQPLHKEDISKQVQSSSNLRRQNSQSRLPHEAGQEISNSELLKEKLNKRKL